MLVTLAQELGNLPDKLSIEGHTDSMPYAPSATHGNWELSADRAHAGRRVIEGNGIRADQVTQVRGLPTRGCTNPILRWPRPTAAFSLIVQSVVKNNDQEDARASGKSDPHDGNKMPSSEQRSNLKHSTPWTGSGSAV